MEVYFGRAISLTMWSEVKFNIMFGVILYIEMHFLNGGGAQE